MNKIKIDDDVAYLTDKKLISNISKFLDDYRDILINKIKDPKVYDDPYIKRDIRSLKVVFKLIKRQVKGVIE
jgi:hypothetical protein